jgi:hypothetical protein
LEEKIRHGVYWRDKTTERTGGEGLYYCMTLDYDLSAAAGWRRGNREAMEDRPHISY